MRAKEAADRLGISQRMLRHYEKEGLLQVDRHLNGYRRYSESDLRRAQRIRDFIASGFSTREIRAMQACLSDDGTGPCTDGLALMTEKLAHIDSLMAELSARRAAVIARIKDLEAPRRAQKATAGGV